MAFGANRFAGVRFAGSSPVLVPARFGWTESADFARTGATSHVALTAASRGSAAGRGGSQGEVAVPFAVEGETVETAFATSEARQGGTV